MITRAQKPELLKMLAGVCLLGLFTTEAATAAAIQIFDRPSVGVNRGLTGRGRIGQRIVNGINIDNLKQTGLASLRLDGKQLVFVDRGGVPFRLDIDTFGRASIDASSIVRGRSNGQFAPPRQTTQEIKEFVLNNPELLQGNQGNRLRNFLFRNGAAAAVTGNLLIDTGSSVIPDKKYALGNRQKFMEGTAAYLINLFSQNEDLLRVGARNRAGRGLLSMNTKGFLRGEALALALNDNPYACSKDANGNAVADQPARLDWLATRLMSPQVYKVAMGLPKTWTELATSFNVDPNPTLSGRDQSLVAGNAKDPNESYVVKHNERLIDRNNTAIRSKKTGRIIRGWMTITYDNPYNLTPGLQTQAASVRANGARAAFQAAEVLGRKPNGMIFGALYAFKNDPNGTNADSAPVEIADSRGRLGKNHGSDVSQGDCMGCHDPAGGQIFGDFSEATGRRYSDNTLNGSITAAARGTFLTNAEANQRRLAQNDNYQRTLQAIGARIPDPERPNKSVFPPQPGQAPLVHDLIDKYKNALTVADAAKELKTTPEIAASLLRTNDKGVIPRDVFEKGYCGAKQALAANGGQFQRNIQQQQLQQRQAGAARPAPGNATAAAPQNAGRANALRENHSGT